MATPVTALAPTGGVDPAIAANVGIVLNAQFGVDEIHAALSEEYQRSVLLLAKDVAEATPATFNVESFANNWTQQLERFKSRSAALTSFQNEFASVIKRYKRENAPELIKALEACRALLDEQVRQQDEISASIQKQITAINKVIAELKALQKVANASPVSSETASALKTRAAGAKSSRKKNTGKKAAAAATI